MEDDVGVFKVTGEPFFWFRNPSGLRDLYYVHDLEGVLSVVNALDRLEWAHHVAVASEGISLKAMALGHLMQGRQP